MNDSVTGGRIVPYAPERDYVASELLIGEGYKLTRDEYQYILHKMVVAKAKNGRGQAGKMYWAVEGYFPNIEQVYRRLQFLSLPKGELGDFQKVYDALRSLHEDFVTALKEYKLK